MMLGSLISQLIRFFLTIGVFFLLFLFIGVFLTMELQYEQHGIYEMFLALYNSMMGNPRFEEYKIPLGQAYIATHMFVFKIFLMSFLASNFLNRYQNLSKTLDAVKRFSIIKLKNSISFDSLIGGVTVTFYPINILMFPFMVPTLLLKSSRFSDFVLKL
mmetsp:Transcript_1501/g.1990  ORF Transcript_1501/g.1990 Transcript_1501/m.1990 type:complete len:159 (+) Transcript_1501:13-489(+)